jgi:nickel/cobalt exporter
MSLPRPLILRVLAVLAATLIMLAVAAPAAHAHPLGNFSINFSSGIRVEPAAVAVVVVMDAAEIPTARTFPRGTSKVDNAEATSYRTSRCAEVANAAEVRLDGAQQPLTVVTSEVTFPPGAAGLATTRLSCQLRTSARLKPAGATLTYRLPYEADRLGWREITAVGDGVLLADSTVPTTSPSRVLTAYPKDLLASPLTVDEATMQVRNGSGTVSGPDAPPGAPADSLSRGIDRLTTAYTNLIASRELTLAFGLLAVVLAMGLGALHAFAPGHGKTLMAATLVGREGTLRQAVTIGLSVTVTHSVGVLLLGLALTFTSLAAPERVYPWLGLISGVLLVAIGITLLRAAMRRPPVLLAGAHEHAHSGHSHRTPGHGDAGDHSDDVDHPHEAVPHSHGFFSHTHQPAQLGTKSLLAVGFTGGLVPSPSALLVLLGGIALGRAWFGVVLVVAYGIGMATALIAVGLALVRGRDWLERHADRFAPKGRGTATARFMRRWLPAATSSLVIMIGLGVAARAASSI